MFRGQPLTPYFILKIVQFSITEMSKHLWANTFTISTIHRNFHTEKKNKTFPSRSKIIYRIDWMIITHWPLPQLDRYLLNRKAEQIVSLRTVLHVIKIYNTVFHNIFFFFTICMLTADASWTVVSLCLWALSSSWASRSWAVHASLSCMAGSIHSVWGQTRSIDILWEGR